MRTQKQYIEGLRKMKRNLYHNGEKIDRDDELQMPALNVMGVTFDGAQDPELEDLCTATSHLTGERSAVSLIYIKVWMICIKNRI